MMRGEVCLPAGLLPMFRAGSSRTQRPPRTPWSRPALTQPTREVEPVNLEITLSDDQILIALRDLHPVDYDSARHLARDLTTDLNRALNPDTSNDRTDG